MAEYMIYPADAIVHKVSRDIPAAHAAFAEPLSCALHAVERASIEFGDVVVVAGCGPIGLGMIAGARAKSPAHVIALDHIPAKLDLAAECGADITLNVGTDNAESVVRDLTEGYGADVYLDATGHPSAVPQGLNLLRKLGRYVEYGVFGSPVTADWTIISDVKELDVLGAHLGPYCWPTAISMIEAKALPLDRICSHQLPLNDFRAGIDLVGRGDASVKVSLLPGAE
jgi:threonine dehydrogenase-like Zn-dependent dehydrogenase